MKRLTIYAVASTYFLTFSFGAVWFFWTTFGWVLGCFVLLLAITYWPCQIVWVYQESRSCPVLSGQIDHPGGGIGCSIGLFLTAYVLHSGWSPLACLGTLVLTIPLGVAFSAFSEWLEYAVANELWLSRIESIPKLEA